MKEINNFFIITLDSLRWDVFSEATLEWLKKIANFRKAHTQGTYTLPSHISIFQGIFPNCFEKIDYYNRFQKQLLKIDTNRVKTKDFLRFPKGTKNIIDGFNQLEYKTIGVGAVGWFKSPLLTDHFEIFEFTGINIEYQTSKLVRNIIEYKDRPKFIFWNIGETHDPFEHGGIVQEKLYLRDQLRNGSKFSQEFFEILFFKQKRSLEYVEGYIKSVYDELKKDSFETCFVICSDHGDCFGEDDLFGHGFCHSKVTEVPLGIRMPTSKYPTKIILTKVT